MSTLVFNSDCNCCAGDPCAAVGGSITVVLSGFDAAGSCVPANNPPGQSMQGVSGSLDGVYILTLVSPSIWTGADGSDGLANYYSDLECDSTGSPVAATDLGFELICEPGGTFSFSFGVDDTGIQQNFIGVGPVTNGASISMAVGGGGNSTFNAGSATISWD